MSPPSKEKNLRMKLRRFTDKALNIFPRVSWHVRSNCLLFDRNLDGRSP